MGESRSLADIVEEQIASGKVELPVFDDTSIRIRQMIDRKEFNPEKVERLVATDAALSGTLLRHANSSFFSAIEKVTTMREAIMRLGVKQVAELVILSSQQAQYRLEDAELKTISKNLWRHAVACGIGSRWLAQKLDMGDRVGEAFLSGLFHDIGKLLLLRVLDDLIKQKRSGFQPTPQLIRQLIDGLHAEQGYALMKSWNLPESYARIARDHHSDDEGEQDAMLCVIRVVDMTCNLLGIGTKGKIEVNVAASSEAQRLRVPEVLLAELEIKLEDAMQLTE